MAKDPTDNKPSTLNKLERLDRIIKNSLNNSELPIEEQAMLAKMALLVEVLADTLLKQAEFDSKLDQTYTIVSGAPAMAARFSSELADTNQNVANLAEAVEALRERESASPKRGARKASAESEKVEPIPTAPAIGAGPTS